MRAAGILAETAEPYMEVSLKRNLLRIESSDNGETIGHQSNDYEVCQQDGDTIEEGRPLSPCRAARTPPLDQGSGSSSPTLSPPPHPLFDSNSTDDEQVQYEVVEEEVALRHGLREGHLDGISLSQDTGYTELAHFQILNQQINWSYGAIDVLDLFDQFVNNQGSNNYSLANDRIADLTLSGEFAAVLRDSEFEAALAETLEIVDEPDIERVLNPVLSDTNTSLDDMIKVIRLMDHSDDLVYYMSSVFRGLERFVRCQRLPVVPNERQAFTDLVLPALDGGMAMVNLAVRRFEVAVYGSITRQNHGRNPFTERHAQGHQADAIVETAEGYQLVVIESAKLTGATEEKIAQDHYKLARDMKDTWTEVVRRVVSVNKQPPSHLTVFGVQAFDTELVFLAMDFKGCFRLYDLATIQIPNSLSTIKRDMGRFLSTCIGFSKLVACEYQKFNNSLKNLSMIDRRSCNRAVRSIKVTSTTPLKSVKTPQKTGKSGKRKRTDVDEN
ncbi:hypothetical protein BGW42_007330 [Actinomortierella wolfii]|nr:hypothetical protein BGW42_007330 [Actinomortierella wolfii]